MTTEQDLRPLVAAQYVALADLCEGLAPERWETASMCEGWRVREVIAHLTMPARYDEEAFMAELRESEFDFTRLSNRLAARDAELPSETLVANLRDAKLHQWTPPGGGELGALNHVVIHGLDVTAPLGEERCPPDDVMAIVLDHLTSGGVSEHFGVDISDQALAATDIDWSYGSGRPVRGTAQELALHLCGRRVSAMT